MCQKRMHVLREEDTKKELENAAEREAWICIFWTTTASLGTHDSVENLYIPMTTEF